MPTSKDLTTQVFHLADERREIDDFTFANKIPIDVRQVKVITMSGKAVTEGTPVGNHYHTVESGRWELFLVIGKGEEPLFKLRTRDPSGEIEEREMKPGDFCIIPPGRSHSFVGLKSGAQMIGVSNQAYDSEHDVEDKLF